MAVIAFWAGVVAVWVYFTVTTTAMRQRWLWHFWTALFLFGGAGALWSALH